MIRFVLALLALVFLALTAHSQTMIVDWPNEYSPHLHTVNGHLKLYSGGWKSPGQSHDTIERSDCDRPDHCIFEHGVMFAQDGGWTQLPSGIALINDPTIVDMGTYMIMYMTVCPEPNRCGTDSSTNEIFYSTSWIDDGVYWSTPVLLLADAWLPSAVKRPDGNVWLYANNGDNGQLFYMNLGAGGTAVTSRVAVNVGSFVQYVNTEVRYYAAFNAYVMVGEQNGVGVIDGLLSYDGINFSMVRPAVAAPVAGWVYVRTPALHPDNVCWLYAAATQDNTYGLGNKIFAKPLCEGAL